MIPITKPYISKKAKELVLKVLESNWLVEGKYTAELENKLKDFIGCKYAIASSSCTAGLHMSLMAIGIKPGDEVIVPSFTFVATANVVEALFAKPVFVDINIDTYNIDTSLIEEKINEKTKAILPVHLFGIPAQMSRIMSIANEYNLKVIEDAAWSLGSFYKGKHVGTFGDTGCFSLHPRKPVTTGEGGMITTNNQKLYLLLKKIKNQGTITGGFVRSKSKHGTLTPDHDVVGLNFRLSDIHAALGLPQMDKIKFILKERKRCADFYFKTLKNIKWLKLPVDIKGRKQNFQQFVCLIKKDFFNNDIEKANKFRNKLMFYLWEQSVETRQPSHAIHLLSYYKNKYNLKEQDFPASYEADKLSIVLPNYTGIENKKLKYIVEKIKEFGERAQ